MSVFFNNRSIIESEVFVFNFQRFWLALVPFLFLPHQSPKRKNQARKKRGKKENENRNNGPSNVFPPFKKKIYFFFFLEGLRRISRASL